MPRLAREDGAAGGARLGDLDLSAHHGRAAPAPRRGRWPRPRCTRQRACAIAGRSSALGPEAHRVPADRRAARRVRPSSVGTLIGHVAQDCARGSRRISAKAPSRGCIEMIWRPGQRFSRPARQASTGAAGHERIDGDAPCPRAARRPPCRPPRGRGSAAPGGARRARDRRACPSRRCRHGRDADHQDLARAAHRLLHVANGRGSRAQYRQAPSFRGEPSVDIEDLPGDIAAGIGAEKKRRADRDLRASRHCCPMQVCAALRAARSASENNGCGELGREEPRRNRVGHDPVARPGLGHGAGQLGDASLGRAVGDDRRGRRANDWSEAKFTMRPHPASRFIRGTSAARGRRAPRD